jgi:hypothetical protein
MDAHQRAFAYNQWIDRRTTGAKQQIRHVLETSTRPGSAATVGLLQKNSPNISTAPRDRNSGKSWRPPRSSSDIRQISYPMWMETTSSPCGFHGLARQSAAKYDKLMAQKMDRVRSAKDLPRVSRPGAAQPRGAAEGQRYQADRQAMRNGDKDAQRVFAKFL